MRHQLLRQSWKILSMRIITKLIYIKSGYLNYCLKIFVSILKIEEIERTFEYLENHLEFHQ